MQITHTTWSRTTMFYPLVPNEQEMTQQNTQRDKVSNIRNQVIRKERFYLADNYDVDVNEKTSVYDPNAPDMTEDDFENNPFCLNPAQV